MNTLHLFSGAGGGLLADLILGHNPIGAVEIDRYCCAVLRQRSKDGWFPSLRVHETDIRLFDPSEYAGRVDCIAGGFPCQDISAAGKGEGITGERSGLWSEFARVIRSVRPRFAFIENSPMLTLRGLDVVLSDLAALGYDAEWAVVSAADAGAPHRRERIWILAYTDDSARRKEHECKSEMRPKFIDGLRSDREPAVANHQSIRRREGRAGRSGSGDTRQSEQSLPDVENANSRDVECGSSERPGIQPEKSRQRTNDNLGGSSEESDYVANTSSGRLHGQGIGQIQQSGRTETISTSEALADADGLRELQPERRKQNEQRWIGDIRHEMPDATRHRLERLQQIRPEKRAVDRSGYGHHSGWWETEPDVGRVAHGVAARVDRLKALGNGQVPLQAALAWRILYARLSRDF